MREFWIFMTALAIAYLLPGPDMVLILQTAARQGRKAALATALGLALARAAHVTIAGAGLATLLLATPWAFDAVRMAGAAYLCWIGWTLLRPLAAPAPAAATPPWRAAASCRAALRRGLLTNISNPKALLFCSVLLPQFIEPAGSAAAQFILLGAVLVAVGAGFDLAYAWMGARLGRWMARHPAAEQVQRWAFAFLLMGFGLRLALA
ncbi:LysE family translocator [Roseomonas marmotae]|uniref:LysE family translocator n=1 Tax=Roseomonas marmotae TaxID=2768161 RepID=A0ABS3KG60_9PROT|nr:LysE family translocator [Roseomonas marmotae]MBO1076440.1 LysE family translocator [Roseomonas marmotae]QTI77957.1 LysE family translocator [Roseomonas marmotae]